VEGLGVRLGGREVRLEGLGRKERRDGIEERAEHRYMQHSTRQTAQHTQLSIWCRATPPAILVGCVDATQCFLIVKT